MRAREVVILSIIALLLLAGTIRGEACVFYFNYQEIDAPLGIMGTIAVRVHKDHQNCSMGSDMDFFLDWSNIQVLEETPWTEVGRDLYEKRLRVVLSEIGSGYMLLYKDCEREGYEEKRLPITVREGGDIWEQAYNGEYPYETEETMLSLQGPFQLEGNHILIHDIEVLLPKALENLDSESEIMVYYKPEKENQAALIVGKTFFYVF